MRIHDTNPSILPNGQQSPITRDEHLCTSFDGCAQDNVILFIIGNTAYLRIWFHNRNSKSAKVE